MLNVDSLRKMPFASSDLYFAEYIYRMSRERSPLIFAAGAIASAAVRMGHICCDLNEFQDGSFQDFFRMISSSEEDPYMDSTELEILFPSVTALRDVLQPPWGISLTEGMKEESAINIPLIIDHAGRLYQNRYFMYEKELAERILALARQGDQPFAPDRETFNHIISFFRFKEGEPVTKTDWQKFAAYLAGFSPVTIITGGPGTGKTTVVAAVLALILEKYASEGKREFPRIMLCAPTGKAQSRLAESIRESLKDLNCSPSVRAELEQIVDPGSEESNCGTIHSLLGVKWNTPNFRRGQSSPLEADILLADEVSMISLPLMCKLLRALKPGAKLILLGDKDQLASVESGAVLGDLCRNVPFNQISQERKQIFMELTDSPGNDLTAFPETENSHPLTGHIAELKISRRFDEKSQIGKVSSMIREKQEISLIKAEILKQTEDFCHKNLPEDPSLLLAGFFGDLPRKIRSLLWEPSVENMKTAYFLLDRFKILCALRSGETGVENMNHLCRKLFSMKQENAPGMPVMILQNDKITGLSNGDIGILWKDETGVKVYFPVSPDDPAPKAFYPHELPAFEPVFAMTIHKSQGSGFDHVLISFPGKESPLLTRELLYTAITRAKKRVELWCPESLIEFALNREVVRHSGLSERLGKKSELP